MRQCSGAQITELQTHTDTNFSENTKEQRTQN